MSEALHQEVEEHGKWIAEHDAEERVHEAENQARWDAQVLLNSQTTETLDKIWEKIDTMQNKIAYFTGFAAFIGALAASIAVKIIFN